MRREVCNSYLWCDCGLPPQGCFLFFFPQGILGQFWNPVLSIGREPWFSAMLTQVTLPWTRSRFLQRSRSRWPFVSCQKPHDRVRYVSERYMWALQMEGPASEVTQGSYCYISIRWISHRNSLGSREWADRWVSERVCDHLTIAIHFLAFHFLCFVIVYSSSHLGLRRFTRVPSSSANRVCIDLKLNQIRIDLIFPFSWRLIAYNHLLYYLRSLIADKIMHSN